MILLFILTVTILHSIHTKSSVFLRQNKIPIADMHEQLNCNRLERDARHVSVADIRQPTSPA